MKPEKIALLIVQVATSLVLKMAFTGAEPSIGVKPG